MLLCSVLPCQISDALLQLLQTLCLVTVDEVKCTSQTCVLSNMFVRLYAGHGRAPPPSVPLEIRTQSHWADDEDANEDAETGNTRHDTLQ